jgi:amino acid transporter
MDMSFKIFIIISVAVTTIILLFGIINLLRNNSHSTSNKLMRYRIIAQFVAIIIIMLALYIMRK